MFSGLCSGISGRSSPVEAAERPFSRLSGEKVRARGRATADSGQSLKSLTPTLSPLKRESGSAMLSN
jgi:hypothetical protein